MNVDTETAYRALAARDRRYDGHFFVGVSSTGIYCRPICTARTPAKARCTFYATAAAAERDAYRPCLRCRPELAPGTRRASVDSQERLVDEALARIDEAPASTPARLAAALGVTPRHLRRVFDAQLGVSPIAVLQTRRLALALRLLRDTHLSVTEVALASHFGSVRRFNALIAARYQRTPTALRRHPRRDEGFLTLRLDAREPFDFTSLLGFLKGREVPGVERIEAGRYVRNLRLHGHEGSVEVTALSDRAGLLVRCTTSLLGVLGPLVARLRHLFDLDADPALIDACLGRDPRFSASLARHRGLRVPGSVDPFELAVRTVLGQQISVAAATTLSIRLNARFGSPLTQPNPFDPSLDRLAPTAEVLGAASVEDVAGCGIVRARAETLIRLGQTFAAWGARWPTRETFTAALRGLRGIGPWTTAYLAMRAWHDHDAFPASDAMVLKALKAASPREAEAHAAGWRPFRAYATLHLWKLSAPA
ncbi:MAG: helix-turn-helix domain-containing protein [Myxococcales bacterium]|nr:helix-turn-helix domain-containing protein [Myxococcales bacterium]